MHLLSCLKLWKEPSVDVRIIEESELEWAELSRRESVCPVMVCSFLVGSFGGGDSTPTIVILKLEVVCVARTFETISAICNHLNQGERAGISDIRVQFIMRKGIILGGEIIGILGIVVFSGMSHHSGAHG